MKQSKTVLIDIGYNFQVIISHLVKLSEYLKITCIPLEIFVKHNIFSIVFNCLSKNGKILLP